MTPNRDPDPKLERTRVSINYRADDGYRQEAAWSSGKGVRDIVTQEATEPKTALMAGLDELARLTALFGFEDEAERIFNEARQRVFEWRKTR